ncbi:extracellular solute-binding protein [Streptomyces daliensis]
MGLPGPLGPLGPLVRGVAVASAAVLLAACGLSGPGGDDEITVDVWLMKDSATKEFTDAFVRDYEKRNPGQRVELTVQPWDGIGGKVTKALESDVAPDVIEVGNTQVAQYVETGHVKDLTLEVFDPAGTDWVPGLAESGKVGGAQYGVPYYAANRVVIYRKDLFAKAGIERPPTARKKWLEQTAALDAVPGQQGIYLPGQNWYVLAGFIWDEGGDLAIERSGQWSGSLDTPEALRGMDFYERLQSLGDAPKDSDEARPLQSDAFARGDVAQMIGTPGEARQVVEANPELRGKLGYFPVPGKSAKKPGAVFTGGSVLIVPERAEHQREGYDVIELLTGKRWQKKLARAMSYVPNRTSLAPAVADDPGAAAMAKGAANGHTAPNSPDWGAVEADNPLKTYQTAVLNGADRAEAARTASRELTKLLGGTPP